MFQAPDDTTVAANLWVFFVEILRPSLTVGLSLPGLGEVESAAAVKLSAERYAAIMDGRAFADD